MLSGREIGADGIVRAVKMNSEMLLESFLQKASVAYWNSGSP
jgi:hypothetical protein